MRHKETLLAVNSLVLVPALISPCRTTLFLQATEPPYPSNSVRSFVSVTSRAWFLASVSACVENRFTKIEKWRKSYHCTVLEVKPVIILCSLNQVWVLWGFNQKMALSAISTSNYTETFSVQKICWCHLSDLVLVISHILKTYGWK